MQTTDFSSMIVGYNLVIGVLIMFASRSIATVTGNVNAARNQAIVKYTRLSVLTVGACWTVISGFVYIVFHVFRFGID